MLRYSGRAFHSYALVCESRMGCNTGHFNCGCDELLRVQASTSILEQNQTLGTSLLIVFFLALFGPKCLWLCIRHPKISSV
jgi:hypothetical protein